MKRAPKWLGWAFLTLFVVAGLAGYAVGTSGDADSSQPPSTAAAPVSAPVAPTAPAPAPAPQEATTAASADAPAEETRPVASVRRLPRPLRAQLRERGFWHRGCPVPRSDLRLLTVPYRGFDRQVHTGQLVVNKSAAHPLKRVFKRLHRIRFPIRHMELSDMYGPPRGRPDDGDVTGSFSCRQAVPSPCNGGRGTGSWSNHAYGLAVDVNPVENPYVGCGQSRDPLAQSYRDRSRHRRGMVGRRVRRAFAAIGWGWGGAWSGNTKDYMHFSVNGH
jgi:hypothetical protein